MTKFVNFEFLGVRSNTDFYYKFNIYVMTENNGRRMSFTVGHPLYDDHF